MLFYTKALGVREEDANYKFNLARFAIGVFLLGALIGAAFVAKWINWENGATTLLEFSKIALGGLVGLLFGERNAVKQIQRRPPRR